MKETSTALTHRQWWDTPIALTALVLLAFLPFISLPFPPLVDLPGHIGRYAIQLDNGATKSLALYYSFEPRLVGNLGVDLLVQWLGPTFGILAVVKWIVVAIPPFTILGMILSCRAVIGKVPATIGFASMFAFGYPFMFGFVNFTLAIALALNLFALWVFLAKRNWRVAQWLLFPFLGFGVYVAHILGWGILGLMVWGYEYSRRAPDEGAWYMRAVRALPYTLPLALPVAHLLLWRGDNPAGATKDLFSIDRKLIHFLNSLRDRWIVSDLLFLVPVTVLIVQAVRKDDFSFTRSMGPIALFVLAAFVLMPRMVFGSDLADMRLAPIAIGLVVLAITPVKGGQKFASIVAAVGFVVLLARLAVVAWSGHIGATAMEQRLAVLKTVPKGARVLQLNGPPPCINWRLPRHYHLGAFNILWNQGFTNAQWDMNGANPVTIHYSEAGYFEHDPSQITRGSRCGNTRSPHFRRAVNAFPREAFDYLFVIDGPQVDEGYSELILTDMTRGARLYKIDHGNISNFQPDFDFYSEFGVK